MVFFKKKDHPKLTTSTFNINYVDCINQHPLTEGPSGAIVKQAIKTFELRKRLVTFEQIIQTVQLFE